MGEERPSFERVVESRERVVVVVLRRRVFALVSREPRMWVWVLLSKAGTSFKTEDENNAKHNPSPQHSLHSLHSQGSREAVSSSNCHLSGTGAGNSKLASR